MTKKTRVEEDGDVDFEYISKLPNDILHHILIKLPPETLIHLISFSNQFKTLITNPHFVQAHLKFHRPKHHFTLSCTKIGRIGRELHLSYSHQSPCSWNFIEVPFPTSYSQLRLVGSAAGVLCLGYLDPPELFLWNPSILKLRTVPNPPASSLLTNKYPRRCLYYGFGFDHVNVDFKLVRVSYDYRVGNYTEVMLYGAKTGTWKSIASEVPCSIVRDRSSVFLDGIVYWLASRKNGTGFTPCIMGFDLIEEVFSRVIELPTEHHDHAYYGRSQCNLHIRLSTSSDGKSLAIFIGDRTSRSSWSVWYFVNDFIWTKRYRLLLHDCYLRPLSILNDNHGGAVLAELHNGRRCVVNGVKEGTYLSDVTYLDNTTTSVSSSHQFGAGYAPSLALLDNHKQEVIQVLPPPKKTAEGLIIT